MSMYLFLIYGSEAEWDAMSDREQQALEEGHRTLTTAAGSAIRFTGELEPVHRTTTLRADGAGGSLAGPGPFLDQAASIGGFYLLEAADDEEALDLAGHLHEAAAGHSAIEVRRVVGAP
jgi:hypothetical protein